MAEEYTSIYYQPTLSSTAERRRSQSRRHSRLSRESLKSLTRDQHNQSIELDNGEPPRAPIQFLLGDEEQAEEHTPHALFIELSEFVSEKDKGNEASEAFEHGWKETAR